MRKITITLTVLGLLVLIAAPSMQAATVISIATDGQLLSDSSARDDRTMVGYQNATDYWHTYLTFDLTDYSGDVTTANSFVLDYQLSSATANGNIQIDYIGTVADNTISTANLKPAWRDATAVKGFTVTDPTAGWHQLDVSSISSDSFDNQYAVFRLTPLDTGSGFWVVGTGTYGGTSGATLTVSPAGGSAIRFR